MLSLVVALPPLSCRAIAYTSASSSDSGKLAEPTTTDPDAPPPDSGLEPAVLEALELALALADVGAAALLEELDELLAQAVTAARAMAVATASPLAVAILVLIYGFPFGRVFPFPFWWWSRYWARRACRRRPAGTASLDSSAKSASTRSARMTTKSAPPATGPYWLLARPSMM